MVVETVAIAAVLGASASQIMIPVAWDLPRMRITILIVVSAAVLAGITSLLLKPLCWHVK